MCATWNSGFEASPATGDDPSDGDDKIREGRSETRIRAGNEHGTYDNAAVGADGSTGADWFHKLGSAVVYFQAAAPTQRPDAATALGTNDKGRIWDDSDNYTRYVYDGSTWQNSPQRFSVAVNFSGGLGADSVDAIANTSDGVAIEIGKLSNSTTSVKSVYHKVLAIGGWNMDSDATKDVSHGLSDYTKIIAATINILGDTDYTQKMHFDHNYATGVYGTIYSSGAAVVTNIRLTRGSGFDSTNFNDATINRGWIVITYEE
jgi:hypothetical protein